jgi:DNA-binding LacI/PurR family transcriptional regulator
VSLGRQHLATISGPLDMPAGQDRLAGFRSAAAVHGHAYVPAYQGDFTRASGERMCRSLLAEHPETDGLFVANDLMAEGALQALRDWAARCPWTSRVVGFDDSTAALACRPPLTTVHQPVEEMAAEMATMLLAQIRDGRDPAALGDLPILPGTPGVRPSRWRSLMGSTIGPAALPSGNGVDDRWPRRARSR